MRVLFIENAGNKSAGAFHSMVSLIKLLRNYGVESYVAVPDKADGLELLEQNNIPYIKMRACSYTWIISNNATFREKIKMPIKYCYSRVASRKLIAYAKENKITLVHENTSACYIGFFAAKSLCIPHIWHIREFLEEDFNVSFWNRDKAIRMLNSSDAVVTISDAMYDKYRVLINENNMHRIYNGIEIDSFYQQKDKFNISETSNILCVGRVCDGKGQADVIKAMVELKKMCGFSPKLYIAGIYNEDYKEKILEPAVMAGISEKIIFLGQCNNMKELYSKMDILCMASHKEAFGRVTVEAMLSGVLVVGANSGGTAEIISEGETGFLYNPADCISLARKLFYVMTNKHLAIEVAIRGQEHAKAFYNAVDNAKSIFRLYQKLLELS